MSFDYKTSVDLKVRQEEALTTLAKYPDRVPVICEKDPKSAIAQIKKRNYIVSKDMKVSSFAFLIRSKLNIINEASIYFLVNGKKALIGSEAMGKVYEEFKDKDDGFLYIHYSSEVTFG